MSYGRTGRPNGSPRTGPDPTFATLGVVLVLLGFAASVYGFGFLAQCDAFFISGNHSTCVGSLDFAGGVALGTFGLLLVLGGAIFYFAGRRTMRRDR